MQQHHKQESFETFTLIWSNRQGVRQGSIMGQVSSDWLIMSGLVAGIGHICLEFIQWKTSITEPLSSIGKAKFDKST